jgi:hypothetical protein
MTLVEVLTDFRFLQNAPTILYAPIRSILVRLVFDPVLLEIWIIQILLQGPHKGDGCLREKMWVKHRVSDVGDITCFKLGMGTLRIF